MAAPRYLRLNRAAWSRLIWHWHVPKSRLIIEEFLLGHLRTICAITQAIVVGLLPSKVIKPIFVLGFWRSGTTLLHELLSADDRFCFPSTFDCFNAHSFVLQHPFARFRSKEIVRRPQDGMTTGWATPQEDEFALLSLGARSPYEGLLAARSYGDAMQLADPEDLTPKERIFWKRTFMRFLRGLTLIYKGKPVLLKSPGHGYRLKTIHELFPQAKFIIVVRNPHDVMASWANAYASFTGRYGLEPGLTDAEVRKITLAERLRYQDKLDHGVTAMDSGRFIEIRYEDLVADPVVVLDRIYAALEFPDFEYMRPRLLAELTKRAGYIRRLQTRDPFWVMKAERVWHSLFVRFGYPLTETADDKTPASRKAS